MVSRSEKASRGQKIQVRYLGSNFETFQQRRRIGAVFISKPRFKSFPNFSSVFFKMVFSCCSWIYTNTFQNGSLESEYMKDYAVKYGIMFGIALGAIYAVNKVPQLKKVVAA